MNIKQKFAEARETEKKSFFFYSQSKAGGKNLRTKEPSAWTYERTEIMFARASKNVKTKKKSRCSTLVRVDVPTSELRCSSMYTNRECAYYA